MKRKKGRAMPVQRRGECGSAGEGGSLMGERGGL